MAKVIYLFLCQICPIDWQEEGMRHYFSNISFAATKSIKIKNKLQQSEASPGSVQ